MARPVRIACVVLMLFLQTGCWNMREVEHLFYAHAAGFERKNGKYEVYAQILDFSTLGKQEGAQGNLSTAGAWVGKGTGDSLHAAIHDLYATSQRRIYWGHLNAVVIGDSLLKEGVYKLLDLLTRYYELRYTIWMYGTRDSVEDVLLASPILESSPVYSQLGDPYDVFQQSSFVQPKRLFRFVRDMQEPGRTTILPMMALQKGHWSELKKNYSVVEIEGIATLSNGKLKETFPKEALIGLRWLNDRTVRVPVEIRSGKKVIANLTLEKPKFRIVPQVRDGRVRFRIALSVGGTVASMDGGISMEEIKKRTRRVIEDQIRHTFRRGVGKKVDLLNLMDALYRKHPREWREITASRQFPLDDQSLEKIEVKVNFTDAGRAIEPPE